MALFKKKKQQEAAPAPGVVEVPSVVHQEEDPLGKARLDLEEICERLDSLCHPDSEFRTKAMQSAAANTEKIRQLNERKEAVKAMEASGEAKVRPLDIFKLEDDLYLTTDELNSYIPWMSKYYNDFHEKWASQTVMTGADAINKHLIYYIENLKEAFMNGKKKKIATCFDTLSYALDVGYKEEIFDNEKDRQERINQKVDVVATTCKTLVETIDEVYSSVSKYEIAEVNYSKYKNEFDQIADELNKIPPDVREKINNLGFKRAMEDPMFDQESEVRSTYFPLIIQAQSAVTAINGKSMELEAYMLSITKLRIYIDELVNALQNAFVETKNFDYNKLMSVINDIRTQSIENVNKINDMVAASQEADQVYGSKIKEASQNVRLGQTIGTASIDVMKYEKLQKKNKELQKRIADNKAAIQKETEQMQQANDENENSNELLENEM